MASRLEAIATSIKKLLVNKKALGGGHRHSNLLKGGGHSY